MEPKYLVLMIAYIISYTIFFYSIYIKYSQNETKRYRRPSINPFDYPFKSMPEGTFNRLQPFRDSIDWLYATAVYSGCMWALINAPELFKPMLIYLLFGIITGIVSIAEAIAPKKATSSGMVVLGYGEWKSQVFVGILISIPFIILSVLNLSIINWQIFQVEGSYISSLILTVFLSPLVEESTIRNMIGFSMAEEFGYIPGVLLASFAFAIAHFMVYNANIYMMLFAFAFGVVTQLVDYYYFSMLPGWVAHTMVNLIAFVMSV